MYFYLGEDSTEHSFDEPLWIVRKIKYGDWDYSHASEHVVKFSENVKNNGSLYLHSYMVFRKKSPNPEDENYRVPIVHTVNRILS